MSNLEYRWVVMMETWSPYRVKWGLGGVFGKGNGVLALRVPQPLGASEALAAPR